MKFTLTYYDGNHYEIDVTREQIIVNGRRLPIKYDREFTYKLQKTQIKSMGLPEFFLDYDENKDGDDLSKSFWNGAFAIICGHVVKYGKCVQQ